jgi:acetamidase/formamidase
MVALIQIDGTLPQNIHYRWSKKNKPIARIPVGEVLRITVPDSSVNQVQQHWTKEDLKHIDTSKFDGASGPVWIEGAESGDALEVEILDVTPGSWGWSATDEYFGLFRERFEDNLTFWDIADGYATSRSRFLMGVRIPVATFLGVMGVAPEEGEFTMVPPQPFGGNMDNRLLVPGAKLYLPVMTEGALFSVADPHAAQGDGESGGTGLETTATATFRFNLIKQMKINFPRAIVRQFGREYLLAMGISDDLYKASQASMDNMISELNRRKFSEAEAYTLCSLAGDLRISEMVDEPNHVVSMVVPMDLLNRT